MAVGFPTKANWAAGDVLTASALDDLAGTVNTVQYLKPWNTILNSNMSIWQRGTSFTNPGNTYTADRWLGSASTVGVITRQATSDTTNLPNIQYCLRYQRTAAATGVAFQAINQSFETVNSIPLAGKTVTLSFYARAGANYSAASNYLNVQLLTGTGTDQNGYTSIYTGSATAISQNATLTATWQRFSYTATLSSSLTELCVTIGYTPVGTALAADYFEITGIQLEQGSVANTYQPNASTLQGELAAAQRYYWRQTAQQLYNHYALGYASGTTQANILVKSPVTMRTAPSVVDYSSLAIYEGNTVTAVTSVSLISNFQGQDTFELATSGATGLTTYRPYNLISNNSTSGYLGFSAEL
jgi:hypothetical protein